jgi:ABC-type phosphate/phosphonate transport system substrate-binding protein
MRIASLSMYVAPEPVLEATDALWRFVAERLRQAGLKEVPAGLDRRSVYNAAWLSPDLLLAQTCGFPYVKSLRGHVRLVATPCYAVPGCLGPLMRSFVIARKGEGISSLEDLRGRRAAVNSLDSNSGMNLFRAAIAPIAGGSQFFGTVLLTGGHAASIAAVAEGRADCAAIDCITYGHILRFAPERLAAIDVVGETPAGPGLPLITRGSASNAEIEIIRAALHSALEEPRLAQARDTLSLTGFADLSDADYDALLALERDAIAHGYPEIG